MNSKDLLALYEAKGGGTNEVEAALTHVARAFLDHSASVMRSRFSVSSKVAVLREADRTWVAFVKQAKTKHNQPYLIEGGFRGMVKHLSPDLHTSAFETTATLRNC